MIIELVTCLLMTGVAFADENPCNDTDAMECFDTAVFYESISFPLYGHDESSLEKTCRNIEESLDCIKNFYNTCNGSPYCDESCKETARAIGPFLSNSGLGKLAGDLCENSNPLRETYLQNVDCLMSNADEYARCHNDSQKSLSFVSTKQGSEGVDLRCCYASWYDHCFTKATMSTCGENATIFVSYASHQLVGEIMGKFCAETQISCETPPMPPEENELDNVIPDVNENKKLSNHTLSSAMVQLSATSVIILSYFSVILSTRIL